MKKMRKNRKLKIELKKEKILHNICKVKLWN